MEDHRDAYFFWKKLGVFDCTCVHVDAHLDTCEFQLPGAAGLQQPEINCGNYLLPAMAEGIVTTLIWVVPPHLPGSDLSGWVRRELPAWVHPSLSEVLSWHLREGRVEGRLKGCRLVVCTSDNLPPLEGPVLLDIDADYFLGLQDEVWQSPLQLREQLAGLELQALTVAYSIEGGYTPPELRWLGDQALLAWQDPERAEDARATGDPPSALDAACFHLQRKQYDRCLAWLERTEDAQAAAYLRSFVQFAQGQLEEALAGWRGLQQGPLDAPALRHLLEMEGRTLMALGRAGEAVEPLERAARQAHCEAAPWLEVARARRDAGQLQEAARSFRRALSLGPELMICLEAQLELVQLYHAIGQAGMARVQRQRLLEHPLPPVLRLQALGLSLRR